MTKQKPIGDLLWLSPGELNRGVIETCCGWTGGGGFPHVPVCLEPIIKTQGDFNNGGIYRLCAAGHAMQFGYANYPLGTT